MRTPTPIVVVTARQAKKAARPPPPAFLSADAAVLFLRRRDFVLGPLAEAISIAACMVLPSLLRRREDAAPPVCDDGRREGRGLGFHGGRRRIRRGLAHARIGGARVAVEEYRARDFFSPNPTHAKFNGEMRTGTERYQYRAVHVAGPQRRSNK